jgi:hypothetical protein
VSDVVHNKFRKGTKFTVTWPSLPSFKTLPLRIDLIQKQYNHDVAILEYSMASPLYFETIKTGVLVEFTWVQEGLSRTWVGYVSSIDKVVNSRRDITMKVHCVGASFPLKQRATRVFYNSSIPEAVEKIAREFGLRYSGVNDSRKFPQLAMTGHSYWEWMQEQAKRIGYALVIDGTNLTFKPIDLVINENFSTAPVMSYDTTPTVTNTMYLDRTLDYFKALNGEHIEHDSELRMNKVVGGVDPITNKPKISVGKPNLIGKSVRTNVSDVLFNDYKTGEVANGGSSVDHAALGIAHTSRFSLPADAKGQGDPRLVPFGTVLIVGTGELTDGFWLVKEAHHVIHKSGDYMVDLKLATDGLGKTKESVFRSRDKSTRGSVNLNEALKNKGKPKSTFQKKDAKAVFYNSQVKVDNQGYNRTPAVWKDGRATQV